MGTHGLAPAGDLAGDGFGQQSLYAGFPNPAGMDLRQFALGNLFDPAFALNKTDIKCSLPCKEACDRDSVAVRRIGPGPATAQAAGLRVIS